MLAIGYDRDRNESRSAHVSALASLPDIVEHLRLLDIDPDIVWLVVTHKGQPTLYLVRHKGQDYD